MTNVELNNIHLQIFGIIGTLEIYPEPIDHCYAEQLIARWVDYTFTTGSEREVSIRFKGGGLKYALDKLICSTSMADYWSCKCGLNKPLYSDGNVVYPGNTTEFIRHFPRGTNPFDADHQVSWISPFPTIAQEFSIIGGVLPSRVETLETNPL